MKKTIYNLLFVDDRNKKPEDIRKEIRLLFIVGAIFSCISIMCHAAVLMFY